LICHRSCYWNFVNFKKKKKPHAISSCYYTLMQTPDNKQIARCHAAIAYDMARPFPQRVRKKSFWEFQARWGKEALFSSNVSLYQKCETSSNQFLKGLRSKGCKARSIRCGRMGRDRCSDLPPHFCCHVVICQEKKILTRASHRRVQQGYLHH
jgi:hypothetical protein